MDPQVKLTSEVPASILTPHSVQTRLGTLRFFDGFPDEETVRKVYDNLDFQRGVQAFLAALPAATLHAERAACRSFGPDNRTVLITESLIDARSLYTLGNAEVMYNLIWLDTRDGPLVLEIPPNVLGFINDFWSRWVTDVGRPGPDRGAGGRYLLLPPDHSGEVPDGYTVLRSRTWGNKLLFRTFPEDGDLRAGGREREAELPGLSARRSGRGTAGDDLRRRLRPLLQQRPEQRRHPVRRRCRRSSTTSRWTPSTRRRAVCSPPSASARTCRSRPTSGCRGSSPRLPPSATPPPAPSSSPRATAPATTTPTAAWQIGVHRRRPRLLPRRSTRSRRSHPALLRHPGCQPGDVAQDGWRGLAVRLHRP